MKELKILEEHENIVKAFKKNQLVKIRSADGVNLSELTKNKDFSLAMGELEPGEKNKWHWLEGQELYYFIEGEGEIIIGEKKKVVEEGTMVIVPPKIKQQIRNTGDKKMLFFCIVNPPYDPKKEMIIEEG